jgi:hypothetical protein
VTGAGAAAALEASTIESNITATTRANPGFSSLAYMTTPPLDGYRATLGW